MRVAVGIGTGPGGGGPREWEDSVTFVVEAERLGVDFAWSAEAWGGDAVTPVAYLAAKTSRIILGTGIMQISARAPIMTAMTAMTLAKVSGNRFVLGLGTSGPQVVEGLHGVPFARPLTRLRETIEIIRLAFRGERIEYQGRHMELPRPGGEGKALRLALPPNPDIPIYLATLAPKSLALTGEVADGWVGTSFMPDHPESFFPAIAAGAEKAGRSLADVDLQAGGAVAFSDDLDSVVAPRKPALAFTLGAMGSAQHNFYNDAFKRAGYEEVAIEVQRLWLERKRDDAVALVPDAMVLGANLLGTEDMVRDRIRRYRDAGITTLRLAPDGSTVDERLATLGRAMELVREVNAERPAPTPGG